MSTWTQAKMSSFVSAQQVGHPLKMLSRNELGYFGAPKVLVLVPLFIPIDYRRECESRSSTLRHTYPSSYGWDMESMHMTPNYARSWTANHFQGRCRIPRQMSNHPRQPSNPSISRNYEPLQQPHSRLHMPPKDLSAPLFLRSFNI